MINFAVIGTGWITESFIRGAEATQKWKLVAVFSRHEHTGKTFGAKFNVDYTFTDLHAMVADDQIHAVYIASPNSHHYDQAKTILSYKKHVIVEKPATSTSKELDDLFKTSEKHGVFLLEANRHLHEGNFKVLQANLDKLGPVYGASLNYASYSSRYNNVLAGETPNIFSLKYSGGALVDLGVYPISAAVALFGKPLSQTYKPVIIKTGADGGGLITLNYERFGVQIDASKCYTSKAPSEVYGEKGTLVANAITDIHSVKFLDAKNKSEEELAGKKAELNLQEEAEEFAKIIEEGAKEAAERLQDISRITLAITEDLRHQNGLVFDVEKGR